MLTAFRNNAVLLTGASRGIGREMALQLAQSGARLALMARNREDLAPLEQVMKVNYFGAVYCVHYALPSIVASRGRVVAVSSLVGLTGVPTRTGYAASKHAMRGFFDSLRIEIGRHGVSVTVAYPGFVDTGIRERAVGEGPGRPTGPNAGSLRRVRGMKPVASVVRPTVLFQRLATRCRRFPLGLRRDILRLRWRRPGTARPSRRG